MTVCIGDKFNIGIELLSVAKEPEWKVVTAEVYRLYSVGKKQWAALKYKKPGTMFTEVTHISIDDLDKKNLTSVPRYIQIHG